MRPVETPRTRPSRDVAGAAILALAGVGLRLAFNAAFPARPFYDFQGLIDFGIRLRDHGPAADGWYWGQFNPGLPVMLSVLFRWIPGGPVVVARTATAVASGLLPLIPFLAWRSVLPYRWRFLAGLLLAVWPGQVFFSGVVAQDNWVLLPAVALGSLAVRRLLGGSSVNPIVGGLLLVWAASIRQEMALPLAPVAVAAALPRAPGRRNRALALLAATIAVGVLALGTQRYLATGRFSISTKHGALGLLGSFLPGSSASGWIEARPYANALDPSVREAIFGKQSALLRMAWEEAKRRPRFHLLRMATWIPRLAADADAHDLDYSLGQPAAQTPARRAAADAFQLRWSARLRWELCLIQGAFVATLALGIRRRSPAILVLAAAVLIKYLIHAVVSPVDRLVLPATALELLAIPIGAAELGAGSTRERLGHAVLAAAACLALVFGVPPLSRFVIRHDRALLPGVRRFALKIVGGGDARCTLDAGAVAELGPRRAALRMTRDVPAPGDLARATCTFPLRNGTAPLGVLLQGLREEGAARMSVRVEVDGREAHRGELSPGGTEVEVSLGGPGALRESRVVIDLVALDSGGGGRAETSPSLTFRFVREPS